VPSAGRRRDRGLRADDDRVTAGFGHGFVRADRQDAVGAGMTAITSPVRSQGRTDSLAFDRTAAWAAAARRSHRRG